MPCTVDIHYSKSEFQYNVENNFVVYMENLLKYEVFCASVQLPIGKISIATRSSGWLCQNHSTPWMVYNATKLVCPTRHSDSKKTDVSKLQAHACNLNFTPSHRYVHTNRQLTFKQIRTGQCLVHPCDSLALSYGQICRWNCTCGYDCDFVGAKLLFKYLNIYNFIIHILNMNE